jgi:DNA-directed RNA polymerase specialized sigma24 family protein
MTVSACFVPRLNVLQARFLQYLPTIERHARFAFRGIRCEDTREDLINEALALAWTRFVTLARRGKDIGAFLTIFTLRCCQAVKSGRRLTQSESTHDVFSRRAQAGHGFRLEPLPHRCPRHCRQEEILQDTSTMPPDEAAAIEIDLSSWIEGLKARDREMVLAMLLGQSTLELARQFRLSSSRVS